MNKFEIHEITWDETKINNLWSFLTNNTDVKPYFAQVVGGKVVKEMLKNVDIKKTSRILDYSCGKGYLIKYLSEYVDSDTEIYGLDICKDSVDYVNENHKALECFKNAFLLKDFPLEKYKSTFDLIILTEVLEHLNNEEIKIVLNNSYELLKSNGYIFITVPNDENLDFKKVCCPECGSVFHPVQHIQSWNTKTLPRLIEQYGFIEKICKEVNWSSSVIKKIFNLLLRSKKSGLYYIGKKKETSKSA